MTKTQTTRMPAGNSRFASGGATFVNSSAVLLFGFCAWLTILSSENPPERKAAKRQDVK